MVGKSFNVIAVLLLVVSAFVTCDEDSSVAVPEASESNAYTRLTGVGECQQTMLAGAGENQQLVVTVSDGKLSFTHQRAIFNCCIDSVALAMSTDGAEITVTETEHCGNPCLCMCPRDVEGEILDLQPGTYSLAVCDTCGTVSCMTSGIVVD